MSPKPARSQYAVLQQLCNLIPPHLVPKLAREHGVDKRARTFSPWSHVVALLYAQLVHALSLHDVCDGLRIHHSKLATIRLATPPSKNALSHANRHRDPAMAQSLFWHMLEHLSQVVPGFGGRAYKALPRRFNRTIAIVDSSTIKLVANCIDWARHRRRKAAAKLHLRLDLQSFLPRFVVIDTARDNDKKHARSLCAGLSAGEIAVFDRGYTDFGHLQELDNRGVTWVTRAQEKMAFHCSKKLLRKPKGNILRDDLVLLTGPLSKKKYPAAMRRVVAIVEVDGQEREMSFITNNTQWAASSICELYKCRWAIEVFFKEIKQTLQLCDFLGHNKSAIQWQVWTALLLYILLRAQSRASGWKWSFKRLICVIRSCAWDTLDLRSLLKIYGTASGGMPLRASPEQAWLPGFAPT